jgi:hypothetical protein
LEKVNRGMKKIQIFTSGGQGGKEGSWEAEKIGSWEKEVRGNDIAWLHGCMVAWISLGL